MCAPVRAQSMGLPIFTRFETGTNLRVVAPDASIEGESAEYWSARSGNASGITFRQVTTLRVIYCLHLRLSLMIKVQP
jgi:hypothetical protein